MRKPKLPAWYRSKGVKHFVFTEKGRRMDVKCARITMKHGRDSSEFKIFKKKFDRCNKEWCNKNNMHFNTSFDPSIATPDYVKKMAEVPTR